MELIKKRIKIDSKGRFTVPAKLRKDIGNVLYLTEHNDYIECTNEILENPINTKTATIDTMGRVQLSRDMRETRGMDAGATLICKSMTDSIIIALEGVFEQMSNQSKKSLAETLGKEQENIDKE